MLLQTVPWEKSLGHFKTLFNVTLGCLPETLSLQNKQVYWLQRKQSSEAACKMELTPHCSFKRWRMNLYLKYVFFNLPWISFLLMKNISEVGGGGKSCWQCRTDGRSWKLQGQAQQELAAYIQKNLGKTWPPPNIKKVTQKPAKSHTPFDASATWYQYSGVIFEKKIGKGCFRWLHIVFTKLYLSHLWQFLQSMYAEV